MSISSPAIAEWADGQSVLRRSESQDAFRTQTSCLAIFSSSRAIGDTYLSRRRPCARNHPHEGDDP
jgi:hypothetical protein